MAALLAFGWLAAPAQASTARPATIASHYEGWQEWWACNSGVCIHTVATLQFDDIGDVRTVVNESCVVDNSGLTVGRCLWIDTEGALFFGNGGYRGGQYVSCGINGWPACVNGKVYVVVSGWFTASNFSNCQGQVNTAWIQTGANWGSRALGWTGLSNPCF